MSILKKQLSVILAVCMLFGVVPITALATDTGSSFSLDQSIADLFNKLVDSFMGDDDVSNEPTYDVDTTSLTRDGEGDTYYRILHLDCGRKYFTKDWIIALINEMSAAGYNQLQLAFGNDGLRFLLDDMSFTVNSTTYSHGTVVSKVEAGNKAQNSSNDDRWLTQTEMDAIIAHATDKGIEIVPLLNLPGHANAMLDIFDDAYNANGSNNTFDITDDAVQNVAYAIFVKYVDYFASKGCEFFNFGADEYANDASGAFSFSRLDPTEYARFVSFINKLATYIKEKGMTPRAFNDGMYYNIQSASIDTDIQCCYWSSGWSSYSVASASTIASKGHKMINTNGDYYYVLKDGSTNISALKANMSNTPWNNTAFMGSTIDNPVGSMFCIWCDQPTNADEQTIASETRMVIREIGARMQGKTTFDGAEVLVDGGFNAYGKINTSTKDPESTTPDVGVSEPEPEITGEDSVTQEEGGTAESYVLDTDELDSGSQYLIVSEGNALANTNNDTTADNIPGVTVSGNYATLPSSANKDTALWEYTKETAWGSTTTAWGSTTNYYLSNQSRYLSPDRSGNWYNDYSYTLRLSTTKTNLTISGLNNGYTVANSSGNSCVVFNREWGALNNDSTPLSFYKYTPSTEKWQVTPTLQESRINAYTLTDSSEYTSDSWTAYQSALTAANAKLTEVKGATYASKTEANAAKEALIAAVEELKKAKEALVEIVTITINYVLENGTNVKTETKTVAEDTTSVKLANFNANDKYYTVPSDTPSITPKTKTVYEVTVTESTEDLSNVSDLTIEYWITNARVIVNSSNTVSISAKSAGINSTDGVDVSNLIAENAIKDGRTLEYWKCVLLDVSKANSSKSGTEFQTQMEGDDETLNNNVFTRVRYLSGNWEVKIGEEWGAVDRKSVSVNYNNDTGQALSTTHESNQLVAYYMEVIDIQNSNGTSELHVNAADWGTKGDGKNSWGYRPDSERCSVSVQLVYEDGSTNPTDTTPDNLKSKTIVYGYWNNGRGLGTMNFNGQGDYEIYKVTADTGTMESSVSVDNYVTVTDFQWKNEPETVWEGDPTQSVSIGNPANNPDYTEPYDNLTWNTKAYNNNNAILIRVYIKAVEEEDTLKVIYYDEKFNAQLYEYNIVVNKDTTFESITPEPEKFSTGSDRITVAVNEDGSLKYHITNFYGKEQYFQTDLTKVPEALGKYKNELYTYTGSEISEDGKTLYLYYNIDTSVLSPNYVVDFGLPITFSLTDILTAEEFSDATTVDSYSDTTKQGTLTYNPTTNAFTYTPNRILQTVAVLSIKLTVASTTNTTNVGVTPATTVYYEEGFINWDNDENKKWTVDAQFTTKQTTEKLGAKYDDGNKVGNDYGYDPAYNVASSTDASTGTRGASGSFTFTGSGVQVFANCTQGESNYVAVQIKDSTGAIKFIGFVDTNVAAGNTSATTDQTNSMASLPIVSLVDVTNLPHGTYTVTITKIADTETVNIDGIRIFNTISDSTIFKEDLEDTPVFYELRDAVLTVLGVKDENDQNPTSVDYKEKLYEQVYNEVNGSAALITDESVTYAKSDALTDLLDNGPKNELFLYKDQTLTFKVETNRMMQLGMKAPQGETGVEITVNDGNVNDGKLSTNKITSSVDMFYALNKKPSEKTTYTVSVKNTGDKLLSVTLLKICDDPNAAFVPFSASDIADLVGYKSENQLPFEPECDDATLNIVFKTIDGTTLTTLKLVKNGNVGGTAVLSKDTVRKAVLAELEQLGDYVLPDTFEFEDIEVAYGTTKNVELYVTLETSELPTTDDDDSFDFDYFAWLRQIEYLRRLDEKRKEEAAAKEDTKVEVETEPETPAGSTVPAPEKPELPFNDIAESDWYFEDVRYAYENGLMIGTSDSEFTPEQLVNRAMLVTILWRLEGSPTVDATSDFTDVPDGEWYSEAVKWAAANGLVNGYGDGKFGPLDDLTREQIMAILNRYADYKGLTDGITVPMLPAYTYSTWSENNVIWADMCGMLANIGKDVTDMTAAADRAEMAAYLRRFCENIVK